MKALIIEDEYPAAGLNRQFISHLSAIQEIHTYFNGKLKIKLMPKVSEEVLVSRDKAGTFKSWLEG